MSLRRLIAVKAAKAMAASGIPAECASHVNYSAKPEFGDLQINGAMGAAKRMGTNPRELAQKIVENLDLGQACSRVEVAGPGFINLFLEDEWLAEFAQQLAKSGNFGVTKAEQPQRVVVDYSSPNLAKEMHVGHIRGTVLGDSIVRVLEFLGHQVIRQNHIGDWGTQFGMLIAELDEQMATGVEPEMGLSDLEVFYRQAKIHFDEDPQFAQKARENVVRLQSGDAHCLKLWRKFIQVSLSHADTIYKKLGVTLQPENVRGESAYNTDLSAVVEELKAQSLAQEDQGAQVVFLAELADKKGNPSPLIVQKADGGFLYATSDLAAIRYRVNELQADRVLYFIDDRQSLHMRQVFAVARKAGWAPETVELMHCSYGTLMGTDGKPFKTRSGDTVKLADLLEEAVVRAGGVLAEKNPDLSSAEHEQVAEVIGIGAVKYADLRMTRTNDYIFDWNSMLSLEGNTAPYLQYAYTRIQSIIRRAEIDGDSFSAQILVAEMAERTLVIKLGQFAEVIEQVAENCYPHELCNYLFDLSGSYMHFYESCPILRDSVSAAVRDSRLQLSVLTANVIQQGLSLLGIQTLDRM